MDTVRDTVLPFGSKRAERFAEFIEERNDHEWGREWGEMNGLMGKERREEFHLTTELFQ